MSKYTNRLFITSPYSNISPPTTCFDMARSSSRDSTTPSPSSTRHYSTPTYNTLPHSYPMSRTSSSSSQTSQAQPIQPTSIPMRRSSSSSSSASTWIASPYRSCLTTSFEEPSSYLSDDDLLSLSLAIETIPNPSPRHSEISTEEQITLMRQMQADEEATQRRTSSNKKQVRFDSAPSSSKARRPSAQLKRRSTTTRRGLSLLNGPC